MKTEKMLKSAVFLTNVHVLKSFAVADKEFGHLIGEIVLEFEDNDFEHESDIEGISSAFGLRLAENGEGGVLSNCYDKDNLLLLNA